MTNFNAEWVKCIQMRKSHSSIIYEARRPLLRLAWNGMDPNYIATLAMDVTEVIILDVRVPCTPVAKLSNHGAAGESSL